MIKGAATLCALVLELGKEKAVALSARRCGRLRCNYVVIAIPVTFWSMGTDSVHEELAHARTGLNGGENGSLSEWTEGRGK